MLSGVPRSISSVGRRSSIEILREYAQDDALREPYYDAPRWIRWPTIAIESSRSFASWRLRRWLMAIPMQFTTRALPRDVCGRPCG